MRVEYGRTRFVNAMYDRWGGDGSSESERFNKSVDAVHKIVNIYISDVKIMSRLHLMLSYRPG